MNITIVADREKCDLVHLYVSITTRLSKFNLSFDIDIITYKSFIIFSKKNTLFDQSLNLKAIYADFFKVFRIEMQDVSRSLAGRIRNRQKSENFSDFDANDHSQILRDIFFHKRWKKYKKLKIYCFRDYICNIAQIFYKCMLLLCNNSTFLKQDHQ